MDYSASEVRWLLGMRRDDALQADQPPSFLSQPDGGGDAGDRLPTIARWADVQRARRAVQRRRSAERDLREADEALAVVKLEAEGLDQRQIAERLEVAQATVSRRATTLVEEILEELGCTPGSA